MIGVRVQCDAEGCGRHLEMGDPDLLPGNGPRISVHGQRRACIVLSAPYVILAAGWTAATTDQGGVLVHCPDHATDWRTACLPAEAVQRNTQRFGAPA